MAPRANWKGLAKPIVTQKTGEFEPDKFEDHYEAALAEPINAKRNGKTVGDQLRISWAACAVMWGTWITVSSMR
jgi:non-homologous end joining protein Ku